MSLYKNIVHELEALISTASKANTEAISETTKFISQLDRSKLNKESFRNMEQKLLSETLVSVAKLNIKYVTELMQLGVNLTRRLNESSSTVSPSQESTPPKSSVSAFEIKAAAAAGAAAGGAFLLNSDKNEPIICEVMNTAFYPVSGEEAGFDIPVTYSPQAFELIKGSAQRVDFSIAIPADVLPGTYKSMISVKGFEHAHFDLLLEVSAMEKQPEAPAASKSAGAAKVKATAKPKKAVAAKKPAKKTAKKAPAKTAKK